MMRKTSPKREIREQNRRRGNRQPYKTIVIVCEGSKTEKIYFEHFKERKSGVRIEVANSDKFTDPVNLVSMAGDFIRKYDLDLENGDSIWCVFDVDRNKDRQLREAREKADRHNITIILSNPSFEIWYLLHYEYTTGALSNAELSGKLAKHLPDYAKNKDVYPVLFPMQEAATERCLRLNKHHETLSCDLYSTASNPSTQVFELVEAINEIKRANGILS